MFVRLLNLIVIAGLICAAAYVYDIKYETTRRAQKVAQLRIELRHERELSASLRAEWTKLETPARIEAMAKRHLTLKPVVPYQFGNIERIPERTQQIVQPEQDLIGAMLEKGADMTATGSIAGVGAQRTAQGAAKAKVTPKKTAVAVEQR